MLIHSAILNLFYQMFIIFSFKAGLGLGTNNFAELCALKLLLYLDRRNSLDKIQIFGDSQLVINWASGKYRLLNLELAMILKDVNRFTDCFEFVSFNHIYRERNSATDALATAGGRILEGSWSIKEHRADTVVETFQVFYKNKSTRIFGTWGKTVCIFVFGTVGDSPCSS